LAEPACTASPGPPAGQDRDPALAGPVALDRPANVFGALSLVVADQAADATAAAAGRSESAAAALSALLHFLDGPSVDRLRQVLGLTSSGTVRLLDRLAESGYVRRDPGADGRSTSVVLTESGTRAAARVSLARAAVRAAVSEHLRAETQREQIGRLREGLDGGVVELPFLFADHIGIPELERLADDLEAGLAEPDPAGEVLT